MERPPLKKVIFFVTHATLTFRHAEMCLQALSESINPPHFDQLIIYNSHQDELSNDQILMLFSRYKLYRFIKSVQCFNYDTKTPKTLGGDINQIRDWCLANLSPRDRVLILKSDILVSSEYLNETQKTDHLDKTLFIPVLYNAKKSVSDNELMELCKKNYVIQSGKEFFFMENETSSPENDLRNRMSTFNLPEVKYLVCSGKRDWSCPYITVNLLPQVITEQKIWGGWSAIQLQPWWIGGYKSFIVHKWHGIISVNNPGYERPGEYGQWLNS